MRAMRKAAGVAAAVLIASIGFAGSASATGGLHTLTRSSFNLSYTNSFQVQTCCQTLSSISTLWSNYSTTYADYSSSNFSWFTTYSFSTISSWVNRLTSRYCPPVPEPTAALAFATGLLVLSRGMRRRS